MNIPVGGDIGEEVHLVDQALTFTQGEQPKSIFGYAGVLIVAGDMKIKHRPRTAGKEHQCLGENLDTAR